MIFFFHFSKQLFISAICVWYNSFLGGFPWLIFFPTGPLCRCLPIISFYLCFKLLLVFSEDQYKNITSNVHMALDICFCVFMLELQACSCTWHSVPAWNAFLERLGKFAGTIAPPLVQPPPEFMLVDSVTQSELYDQSHLYHTVV